MYQNKFILVSIIFLIISIIFTVPFYGFYTILRIVVTLSAVLIALNYQNTNNQNKAFLYWFIAILFNPFIPIYLDKILWRIIDVVILVIYVKKLKEIENE